MNVYNVNKKGRKFISDFGSWCLLDFNLMNNYKKSEIVTFLIHFADKIMNIGMNENSKGKDLNRKCLEGAMMLMNRIYEEFCKKENSFNN